MNGTQKTAKQLWEADENGDRAIGHSRARWIPLPAEINHAPKPPHYLFHAWDEIENQILHAQICALLLDFDGTLVKLQRRPWEVRVSQRTKRLLERLARNPNLFVAIVSGRRRQDLQARIGIEALHYIGLHGAEADGKSIKISNDVARILAATKREAQKQIASMSGIRIEDKGLSFAVHYREAKASVAGAARSRLLELVAPVYQSLKVFEGAMVWEVLPHEIKGKGAAARTLLSKLPKGTPAVYIGDDGTDESAFRSLGDQITVRVGNAQGSYAKYYLRDPHEVMEFLLRLEAIRH